MDAERIAEIRLDADQEAKGLEPGYWQDTIFELCDALDAARADVARLREQYAANLAEMAAFWRPVARDIETRVLSEQAIRFLVQDFMVILQEYAATLAATEAQP